MPEAVANPALADAQCWSRVTLIPRLVATVGGCGFIKPAPGTWGTLAALLAVWLCWQVAPLSWYFPGLLAATSTVSLVGVWAANACIRATGIQDPGPVVIDEVAGVWTTLLLIPPAVIVASPLTALIVAFVLFRLFDITKPWPISALERLPRGWGVMADDLAAGVSSGILAGAVLR